KDPADRFAKASDFAEQLRRWLDGESVIRPPSLIARARRWRKRNRRLVTVAGLAAGLVIVAGAVALEGNRRADERERQLDLEAQLRSEVQARKAEVEALALLDKARQRLQ